MTELRQQAPYPHALVELVARVRYKPGWQFWIGDIDRGQGSTGLTLIITIAGPDSYDPASTIRVNHYLPVPPAAYDERSWRRWLFEQILLVERHECCEFFQLATADGGTQRPFAPSHGPGNDPYLVRELGTREDQRMSFRGELNPEGSGGPG